jgi:cell division protein FtsI/penicillin-binding protein 2
MKASQKTRQKRINILATFLSLCVFFLISNLVYLQVVKFPYYKKLSEQCSFKQKEIKPRRGAIFDRKMRPLAQEALGGSIFLRPSDVEDATLLVTKLSSVLSIKEDELTKGLLGPSPLIPLRRNIDSITLSKVEEIIKDNRLKGIELQEERRRIYPNGHLGAHILGFVNIDQEPLEGCEKALNRYLGGEKGLAEGICDIRGNFIPTASRILHPARDGLDVVLTIDCDIQRIVEEELDKAYEELKPKSEVAIVMNPQNGEILALANRPTFDPNEQSKYPPDYKRNRAVTDLFEVGSVLKPIIIASALQEGVITPSSRFYCSGKLKVGGRLISCVVHHKGGHGSVTPEKILVESCNVGAAQVGMKLGAKRMYRYLLDFGFGLPPTDELTGAQKGVVPPPEEWSNMRTANVSFGQGISITPLHLLSAFCALVNGGVLYKPHILKAVIQQDGKRKKFEPEVISRPLSPEVANMVRDMLVGVVESKDGTAYKRANVEGVKVGGKTGTAQKVINGRYTDEVVASFVGFLPADNPRLAILVLIDQPQINRWGATAAAPVFKQIATRSLACLGFNPKITPITLNTLQSVASQRSTYVENKP